MSEAWDGPGERYDRCSEVSKARFRSYLEDIVVLSSDSEGEFLDCGENVAHLVVGEVGQLAGMVCCEFLAGIMKGPMVGQ